MGTLRGIVRFLWWPTCLPTIRRRDATPQNREQHTGTVYAVLQEALKKMPSNEFTRVCLVRCILRECPGTFPSIRTGDTRVPTRVYSGGTQIPTRVYFGNTRASARVYPVGTRVSTRVPIRGYFGGTPTTTQVYSGNTRASTGEYFGGTCYLPEYTPGVPGYPPEYTPGVPGYLPECDQNNCGSCPDSPYDLISCYTTTRSPWNTFLKIMFNRPVLLLAD